jgi:glycosyltransferase involved in cell wall biosynthesis
VTARTLVVIPTYNERHTVAAVIERALAAPVSVDVLVVDDGSPDGTGRIADRLAAEHREVAVLHRTGKDGLGSAYRAGLGWGLARGYDVLVEMDADLSHDPAQLPDVVGATDHADLVIGSRYVPGGRIRNWPRHRLALSAAGNRYVQVVTGVPIRDATSGFRAYRRPVLDAIRLAELRSDGYAFQLETALRTWRAGFRIAEVPITFVERRAGASKISRAIVLEAIWRVLVWGVTGRRGANGVHPASVVAAPR